MTRRIFIAGAFVVLLGSAYTSMLVLPVEDAGRNVGGERRVVARHAENGAWPVHHRSDDRRDAGRNVFVRAEVVMAFRPDQVIER